LGLGDALGVVSDKHITAARANNFKFEKLKNSIFTDYTGRPVNKFI
jgi:hypothetical protein